MKKHLLTALLLLGFALPAWAKGGVANGSVWFGGGVTVVANVGASTATTPPTTTISVFDPSSGGASPAVPGSMGAGGTVQNPLCGNSDVTTTPGGKAYRAKGEKLQRKNARGQWVTMTKARTKKGNPTGPVLLNQGEPAPRDGVLQTIHGTYGLKAGQPAPWDGVFIQDEVTSLPY